MTTQQTRNDRRTFLKYLAASPLANALAGIPFNRGGIGAALDYLAGAD